MAKKAKAAAEEGPVRSKEEIFRLHHPDILKAKIALEEKEKEAASLRGIYRNYLKAYGKAGGDVKAMATIMQLRKEDPDQLTRDYRSLNEHCIWGNIPIGAQLDIFGGGFSPADAAEREQMTTTVTSTSGEETKAYHEGELASVRGANRDACPYTAKRLRDKWHQGWDDNQEQRAMSMGPREPEPVEHHHHHA